MQGFVHAAVLMNVCDVPVNMPSTYLCLRLRITVAAGPFSQRETTQLPRADETVGQGQPSSEKIPTSPSQGSGMSQKKKDGGGGGVYGSELHCNFPKFRKL